MCQNIYLFLMFSVCVLFIWYFLSFEVEKRISWRKVWTNFSLNYALTPASLTLCCIAWSRSNIWQKIRFKNKQDHGNNPMSAASISRKTIRACLGIYLKNRRKIEFMQQTVMRPNKFKTYYTEVNVAVESIHANPI